MGRFVFVDTETTGLPQERKKVPESMENNWPDIISIAWSVYETEDKQAVCMGRKYHIVKPEGWTNHPKAEEVQGISIQDAERLGAPLSNVMVEFQKDATDCTLVAHGLHFDLGVIQNAFYWRLGKQKWKPAATV